MDEDDLKGIVKALFPSPCGVLVLKCSVRTRIMTTFGSFPSPCGVLVLKCDLDFLYAERDARFPSPCGVLVLKS